MSSNNASTPASTAPGVPDFPRYRESVVPVTTASGETVLQQNAVLCQHCPNHDCPGATSRDDDDACRTLVDWLDGDLQLERAIKAKHRHAERHTRTDRFREWIFEQVLRSQFGDEWPHVATRSEMVSARDFAVDVAKGADPYARRDRYFQYLPDDVCRNISATQDEVFDDDQSVSLPVEVGFPDALDEPEQSQPTPRIPSTS